MDDERARLVPDEELGQSQHSGVGNIINMNEINPNVPQDVPWLF